jgi:hypothetical protein
MHVALGWGILFLSYPCHILLNFCWSVFVCINSFHTLSLNFFTILAIFVNIDNMGRMISLVITSIMTLKSDQIIFFVGKRGTKKFNTVESSCCGRLGVTLWFLKVQKFLYCCPGHLQDMFNVFFYRLVLISMELSPMVWKISGLRNLYHLPSLMGC